MALTKLRLGQIDLRDLESSELASANSVGNALSNLSSVGATSNTLMGTVSGNVSVAVDTLQDNVDTQTSSLGIISGNVDADASTFAAYATYANTTFTTQTYVDGEIANLVANAGSSLDTLDELAAALNDDANAATTLTTTIGTISGNVATYSTDLDSVNSNLDSYATYANSQISGGGSGTFAANGESVSNTIVYFEGGDGISLTTNTTSQTLTLSMEMSNATTQEISMNGASNVITLTKGAANANMLLVFYNGLAQRPSEYTVSGTTLTLSNSKPIIAGSNVEVRHFDFFPVTGVNSGGVYSFQGSNFGYVSGGLAPALVDKVERYSFTSDANGADVGELSYTSAAGIGLVSSTAGYDAGGQSAPNVFRDTVNKFDFSSSTSGSNIATMTTRRRLGGGASSESYGYALGGHYSNPVYNESFEKISFTSNTNGLDVAEISQAKTNLSGHSSETHGYISGGYYLSPTLTTVKVSAIEKTPFSSETSTSSVGALTAVKNSGQGYSSDSFGYFSGGNSPVLSTIEYFPFASDTNATDGGADLAVAVNFGASSSSTTSGYTAGGENGGSYNTIQKFPFSSNDNASDIADLSVAGYFFTGTQN